MYQSMLRSYWELNSYLGSPKCPKALKDKALSDEEWEQLAQLEAIHRSTKVLSLALQTETAGAIAVAPLLVALSRFQIPKCDHGVIVDVVEIGPECGDATLFDQLSKKKTPMRYHEATDMSKKLMERLTEEYFGYTSTYSTGGTRMVLFTSSTYTRLP